MYLTTQRVAPIKKPEDPPYTCEETFVHGYLYTHGTEFRVDEADLKTITTLDPGGEFAEKLVGGLTPGGNAVISYLDIVAPDSIRREVLEGALDSFHQKIIAVDELPQNLEQEGCYLNYHISVPSYRDTQSWSDDFCGLKDSALQLFEQWREKD